MKQRFAITNHALEALLCFEAPITYRLYNSSRRLFWRATGRPGWCGIGDVASALQSRKQWHQQRMCKDLLMKDGSRLTGNGSERRRKYEVPHWALKGDQQWVTATCRRIIVDKKCIVKIKYVKIHVFHVRYGTYETTAIRTSTALHVD